MSSKNTENKINITSSCEDVISPNLNKLSKKELLEKCEELGITRCKSKNKGDIIELIKNGTSNVKNSKIEFHVEEEKTIIYNNESKSILNEKMNTEIYTSVTRDIMNLIEIEDIELLKNNRILNMTRNDWGKTISVSNQYIQRNILKHMLCKYGDYNVYSTDEKIKWNNIDIKNNSPGFDLVIQTPDDKYIRVQSKLRQVRGIHDWSQQIHFETTRRNSKKNKDKNHTGHICYSGDEFDLVMISIINDRLNRDYIKNVNFWSFFLIPIKELLDSENKCCYSHIKSDILKKNIIKIKDDIRDLLYM